MGVRRFDRRHVVGSALVIAGGLALPGHLAAQTSTDRAASAMAAPVAAADRARALAFMRVPRVSCSP